MIDAPISPTPTPAPEELAVPRGVVLDLGTLPDAALLNEEALARMLSRSRKSVKRAVQRGELPPPVRLMGQPSWTVISIRRHFEVRLSDAAKVAERRARRLDGLRPAGAA